MAAPPQIPAGWDNMASFAYLLMALVRVDGGMTQERMNRVVAQLMGASSAPERVRASVEMAARHEDAWMKSEYGVDGWYQSLKAHSNLLAKQTTPAFRKVVVAGFLAVAPRGGVMSDPAKQFVAEFGGYLNIA